MKHEAEQFPLPGVPVPEPAHHRHGMSILNALAACPGYVSRGGTNQAAEDGTRLHKIMESVIKEVQDDPSRELASLPRVSAKQALQIVLVTTQVSEEELIYLEYCCREFDFWLARNPKAMTSEGRVQILNPDDTELNFGTFDLLLFLTDEVAVLFDWKFGWIPVPAAQHNYQGQGYAVGVFQKYPKLTKLGVSFVQPKLRSTTHAFYHRTNLFKMYAEVRDLIRAALSPTKTLRPCSYCDYCGVAATCKALLNDAALAVSIHEGLTMPEKFIGLQIETPEEAARALYVLGRLEVLVNESGLKDKAKELCREHGSLSCTLPNGEKVVVEMKQRNSPRSANSPMLIAEALKDVLLPEQVLGACDLKITRLEEIFAEAFVEKREAEAKGILAMAAKNAAAVTDPVLAKDLAKTAAAQAKAARSTKKNAVEVLNSVLLGEGLVTSPEGKVDYLKVRVEKQEKQLTNDNSNS